VLCIRMNNRRRVWRFGSQPSKVVGRPRLLHALQPTGPDHVPAQAAPDAATVVPQEPAQQHGGRPGGFLVMLARITGRWLVREVITRRSRLATWGELGGSRRNDANDSTVASPEAADTLKRFGSRRGRHVPARNRPPDLPSADGRFCVRSRWRDARIG
jgi:hypothetical protein